MEKFPSDDILAHCVAIPLHRLDRKIHTRNGN